MFRSTKVGWNPASIQRSGGEGEGVIVRRLYRRGATSQQRHKVPEADDPMIEQ